MTDRHIGYIVVLEEDIREDDAEATILNAIRMIKGVATVDPILTDSTMIHAAEVAAETRAKNTVMKSVQKALYPEYYGEKS